MSDAHGTPNGTGRRPPDPWTAAEREVLRLLEGCSLRFLGQLKLTLIGDIQRRKMGVSPSGAAGSNVARER